MWPVISRINPRRYVFLHHVYWLAIRELWAICMTSPVVSWIYPWQYLSLWFGWLVELWALLIMLPLVSRIYHYRWWYVFLSRVFRLAVVELWTLLILSPLWLKGMWNSSTFHGLMIHFIYGKLLECFKIDILLGMWNSSTFHRSITLFIYGKLLEHFRIIYF